MSEAKTTYSPVLGLHDHVVPYLTCADRIPIVWRFWLEGNLS
jgi:hypothetical protein